MVGSKNRLCVVKCESALKYRLDIYTMGADCYISNSVSYLLTEDTSEGTTVEIAWVGFNDIGQVAIMDNFGMCTYFPNFWSWYSQFRNN
jgi:hypothetical protein